MRRDVRVGQKRDQVAQDSWSVPLILALPVLALALVLASMKALVAFVLLLLAAPIVLLACFCYLVVSLATARFRKAASVLIGLSLGAAVVMTGPLLARRADDRQFASEFTSERAQFDELMQLRRAQIPASDPVRLVVKYEDKTDFALTNIFQFVIYDETDEAADHPENINGYWPYIASKTGVLNISGNKSVTRIKGHYYRIRSTS